MRILLADDDHSVRRVIQFKLEKRGYTVMAVENGIKALDALKSQRFDLLLSDIRMPGLDGMQLMEQAKKVIPDLKTILITAHGEVSQAVQAVKKGAFDYLTKPFEDDELFVTIDKALAFEKLERENQNLKNQLENARKGSEPVGISNAFREMMSMIEKVAPSDATILITGESGTGKELIARTIHEKSLRAAGEFVAVNCAAIPRDLLESELFGHVRGAFTGAIKDKRGRFELAEGGTILLDEIGDLALDLQVKLLRVLQERQIEPVGSEHRKDIDVRVIASTNVNLKERIFAGSFREDLFYRLNVIPIKVPSLRERKEDIPLLAETFLRRAGGNKNLSLSPDLIEELKAFSWPGNVRELENIIERMTILRSSDILMPEDLPDDFNAEDTKATKKYTEVGAEHITFHEAEKNLIINALNTCGWNRTRAAQYLHIARHVLIYRMKKYGISSSKAKLD
ncbi:MAG: sigma-54 dependent transcriptional regulator [candidate division Zixibacteria bacterium]